MNIVICGAGDVGSHAAESLAGAGHNVTVVDLLPRRLATIGDTMDVRTLQGNCAEATVLDEAGADAADMVVAATDADEINLLTASLAKGLGALKSVARIHHSPFLERSVLDYQRHLNIDRLICPELATALAIARRLRNPGAVAIESFARGRIEMQEFTAAGGSAIGKRLMDVKLPEGTRLALIGRKKEAFIPEAKSVVVAGDSIIMVGNAGAFEDARKLFHDSKQARRRVVLMGGPPMAVWLCRSLRDRNFSIRLFERNRARAEVLAETLDGVTVIQADPTDRTVFAEEKLAQADVFVSLLNRDEANIIAAVMAKTRGVTQVLTVVRRSKYLDVIFDIGIDRAFSPRQVAAEEIDAELDDRPLRHLGSLAEGFVDVFRVRVGPRAPIAGKPLKAIKLSPDWVVAAVQRGIEAHVPVADDVIEHGDVALVVGKHGKDATLRKLFGAR